LASEKENKLAVQQAEVDVWCQSNELRD